MLKCKVCRKWFKLKTEDRYDIVKSQTVIGALMEVPVVYEAFDCPKCGCQNIVNVREGKKKIQNEEHFAEE